MAKLILSICTLIVVCTATTPNYMSYNSSDISYLSNGIQLSVTQEFDYGIGEEVEDVPITQWMSSLYDHYKWNQQIAVLSNNNCSSDMMTYLAHLKNNTSWAVKMTDASGRYGGQFLFGNDFWLGSSSLCIELANVDTNKEIPPFGVQFYTVKIRININQDLTPVSRQLTIGECLPASCTKRDVRLLMARESFLHGVALNVLSVRTVPGNYSVWKDNKFYIVGGVGTAALLVVLAASVVEYVKKNGKKQVKDAEIQNNNNNDEGGVKMHLKKKQNCEERPSNEKFLQVLLCFSAVENARKILEVKTLGKDSIQCIHGLRFFSIAWIILVHTYLEVFAIAENKMVRVITERNFMYQTISNATFSVDTFFFISGLLVTVTYFRNLGKPVASASEGKSSAEVIKTNVTRFLLLVLYRFLRLTPAYLFVLGVNELVLRYAHNNSVFEPAIIDHITCSKYWWRNALYINNFFPQQEFCMLWSWYISNDTQFFLLATVLLLVAVRGKIYFKWAASALVMFLISSWIITFMVAIKYNYVARVEEPFALFDQLYDKPWMRIGPYLVGMSLGYILFKYDTKIHIPKMLVALGWLLSLSCLAALVYGLGRDGLEVPASAFYVTFGHTAWGLSLAWITFACCTGHGGPINAILAFRGLLPLSRLTYCAYLVHPMIMCFTSFKVDGPIHLHQVMVIMLYFGNALVSFFVALAVSLAFEAPVVRLLKIRFKKNA